MRTLTKYTIIVLASPFVLAGAIYGFCVGGFKVGIDLMDRDMDRLADWVNG